MAPALSSVGIALSLLAVAPLACSRGNPPAPDASPAIALPDVPVPPGPRDASPALQAAAAPLSADAAVDPSLLPQTHDVPHASGALFDARVAALWEAIVTDDAEKAMVAFFPLGAYRQVKDVPDPASDWKHRLVAAYGRDIHALHVRLGKSEGDAKLTGMDVPESRARWVDPGEEYNKIGYYRVFGSKLRYEVNGEGRSFDIRSLISWRGEWYLVHLSAMK
jgi:hypothetical protein